MHEKVTRCPDPLTGRQDRRMPPAPLPPGPRSRRAFLGALGAAGGLAVAGSMSDVAFADSGPDSKTFFPLVLSADLVRQYIERAAKKVA